MTVLDSLYPTRCYDCLTPIARDSILCDRCKSYYARANEKRRAASYEVGRIEPAEGTT